MSAGNTVEGGNRRLQPQRRHRRMRQSGCARLSFPHRPVLRQRRFRGCADEGIALSAAASGRPAQIYDPMHIVAELDGPARIDLPRRRPVRTSTGQIFGPACGWRRTFPSSISLEGTDRRKRARFGASRWSASAAFEAHMRRTARTSIWPASFAGASIEHVASGRRENCRLVQGESDLTSRTA